MHILRSALILLLTLAGLSSASAQSASTAAPQLAGTKPWREAVVSVKDLDDIGGFLKTKGGWQEVASGNIERAELSYYGLTKNAGGSYRLMCASDTRAEGCIRLVRFTGVAQRPIRLAARPWDTGGIFSLMVRVASVPDIFKAAIDYGWWAESEPIFFSFGTSDLRNVVITGPHGINFALYERMSPPFDAFGITPMSRSFNSMRMVRNQKQALAFYSQTLGFATLFNADYLDDAPTASNFSIPHSLAPVIPRRAAVVYPEPTANGAPPEAGRIELMQFPGFTGRDFSSLASPPNLGILTVRYETSDADALAAAYKARGIPVAYGPATISMPPYGSVRVFAVRDPDGSLTEFFSPLK